MSLSISVESQLAVALTNDVERNWRLNRKAVGQMNWAKLSISMNKLWEELMDEIKIKMKSASRYDDISSPFNDFSGLEVEINNDFEEYDVITLKVKYV